MKTAIENIWTMAAGEAVECPRGVEGLRQRLVAMGAIAQELTSQALQALVQRDRELAFCVNERDRTLDYCRVEIDRLVVQELSKGLSTEELRLVPVIMKISHELEAIGNAASRIARQSSALCDGPPLKAAVAVPRMAILSLNMLNAALKAFNECDSSVALEVIPQDKEIDAWNLIVRQKLIEQMVSKPERTKCCLRWMAISHSLGRIGDHVANIAEDVILVCDGRNANPVELKGAARSLAINN